MVTQDPMGFFRSCSKHSCWHSGLLYRRWIWQYHFDVQFGWIHLTMDLSCRWTNRPRWCHHYYETAPWCFTVACSDTSGNGCGTVAVIIGGFALATDGETISAYADNDTDPTNGVVDIFSMMFTGVAGSPGGNLPAIEDPTGICLSALIVDGFPASAPVKTEYTPAGRAIHEYSGLWKPC